jgi:iron complex transport system substrate-binding protein
MKTSKNKGWTKKQGLFVYIVCIIFFLTACVDQSQGAPENKETETLSVTQTQVSEDIVILATSMATVSICDKLNLTLAGIPDSNLSEPPKRYQNLPKIGMAMSPDMEVITAMSPDWILSPVSLISDLKPKYEAIGSKYAFLNLNSVAGMYKSIEELGEIFDRQEEAKVLIKEFEDFYNAYKEKHSEKEAPSVLILMGLPGSYVAATEHSYVGDLVKLAGGRNVYMEETKDFISVNTEDMLAKNPDIILRTAHALPDEVMEMFAKEFKTNDIWKNFNAVKAGRVYDLSYEKFGMSATFDYPEALEELDKILYGEREE